MQAYFVEHAAEDHVGERTNAAEETVHDPRDADVLLDELVPVAIRRLDLQDIGPMLSQQHG